MSKLIEIRIPLYPECGETCGNCAAGALHVGNRASRAGNAVIEEMLAKPGDMIQRDDNVIALEAGRIALDIPSPHAGCVVAVMVAPGQQVAKGAVILTLEQA